MAVMIGRLGVTFLCVWFVAVGGWGSTRMVTADIATPDCTSALGLLGACIQFATGEAPAPTETCCSSATQVHLNSPVCLCVLSRDDKTTRLIPNYRLDLAAQIPALCKIQGASIANCPALLGEINATAPAAVPASGVASSPSTQSTGAASRLTFSANHRAFIFTYLALLLVSSILITIKY